MKPVREDVNAQNRLVDAEQLDFKDECGVGGNCAGVAVATVAEFWRYREFYFVADLHLRDADIPTGDDLTFSEYEREGFIAIHRAVELFTIGETSGVMDGDGVALFG